MLVNIKPAVELDNVEEVRQMDAGEMLKVLYELPEQCQKAWEIGLNTSVNPDGEYDQVLVTGLGGSAIGGDLLRVYALSKLKIPVLVNRDYTVPEFVGPRTLVFAASYSGNTEETLSAYANARQRGAKVVCLTTGGKLAEMAQKDGVTLITIPDGISPRAATGYLFLPMVAIFQKLGLVEDATSEIQELIEVLKELRLELALEQPEEKNLAKQLARRFFGHIPVIYGTCNNSETVAMRWKGQINENSKAMAYYNILPELNHNEIVGTEKPETLLKKIQLVYLRDSKDHLRVQKRFDIMSELIGDKVAGITEVRSRGQKHLARMYSLIYVGDYTSVYLALLYGIDPTPVRLIDSLKKKLAEV